MWIGIALSVLLLLLAGVLYLTIAIRRFSWIAKSANMNPALPFLSAFLILTLLFVILSMVLSFVNAIIILLHAVCFFLLSAFVAFLLRVGFRWKLSYNVQGSIAILATILTMIIAYHLCNHVWQTNYSLKTEKPIGSLRVALLSDSHLGTTFDGDGFAHYIKAIQKQHPDILLIAGDFVDHSAKRADVLRAAQALHDTSFPYGVWFSFGNHDEMSLGIRDFEGTDLRRIFNENGIHILEDSYENIDDRFYIVGRKDASSQNRMDIHTLLRDIDSRNYVIVLDHQPNDYAEEEASSADLVLSGHTHGGQLFPIHWIGRWIHAFDRAYGYEKRNNTEFIVTSGISDWEIRFKTGTKSEYVIIDIQETGK